VARVRALGHPLCAGIDPHPERIPPLFARGSMEPDDPETVPAVEAFCLAVLDHLTGRVAVVKPQIALFEALGWRGFQALERVLDAARERELLVVLDAKRGDIASTAEGYARAYLGAGAALAVDAITLNPWLGLDSLDPFLGLARAEGRGVFVVTRSSNPGARDFQDLDAGGRPVHERVAEALAPAAAGLAAPQSGWSSLGVVVGATSPDHARRLRAILPRSLFLVPGYGAQGAGAAEAVAGFVPGPGGRLEGGIVNASRSILFPTDADTDDVARWDDAVEAALDRAIDELSGAVAGGAGA
jgi:orotidine-5'-phosphate decarboxylase